MKRLLCLHFCVCGTIQCCMESYTSIQTSLNPHGDHTIHCIKNIERQPFPFCQFYFLCATLFLISISFFILWFFFLRNVALSIFFIHYRVLIEKYNSGIIWFYCLHCVIISVPEWALTVLHFALSWQLGQPSHFWDSLMNLHNNM